VATTTARKTTASRKRTAAPARAAAAAKPKSPGLVELFTEQPDGPVEMVPLFSIDGVEYCIPAEPDAGLALRFMRQVRTGTLNEMEAMDELLENLLGPESYQALLDFKGKIPPKQLLQLMQAAQAAVMGVIEAPKGT
jgi:hypothetical protein